jgi:hypothetical protein
MLDKQIKVILDAFSSLPDDALVKDAAGRVLLGNISDEEQRRRRNAGLMEAPIKLGGRQNFMRAGHIRELLAKAKAEVA